MGAFGSCLGVGRPMKMNDGEPGIFDDARAFFNIEDPRINHRGNVKIQAQRGLTKRNPYFIETNFERNNRNLTGNVREFNVASALGKANSKLGKLFKHSSSIMSQSRQTFQQHNANQMPNNVNGIAHLHQTQPKLVDIDDNLTSTSFPNHKPLTNNNIHTNNNNSNIIQANNNINRFQSNNINNQQHQALCANRQQISNNNQDLRLRNIGGSSSSNSNSSSNCNNNNSNLHIKSNLATNKMNNNQMGDGNRKILIALFDYEPMTKEDLGLKKGDHLEAISLEKDGLWWLARSKTTKKEGYVPSNYVAELKSLGAEPWYFGKIGRLEAENCLKGPGNGDGSFIIRDAEADHRYSLSVRHQNDVKHYRIREFSEGGYYLRKTTIFSTLHDFVSHYSAYADGLCVELRAPCIASGIKPTVQGLSYDTCDKWEIDRNELELIRELGHGQFGQVYEGLWNNRIQVAVKTLKPGSMDPQEFITEAQIMKNLRHPKLVQLYAVCTREEPIYIVTERMRNGCLSTYLQKNRKIELRTLVHFGCQIADGMAYLEENNYLHRDLAARNILVGDENIVKIADFGLARLMKETEYEARPCSKCPIKWTSPESITFNRWTSKSDVWSFGIVLYEIITFGNTPYPGMNNHEMLQKIERGYRMPLECMPGCPKQLYDIMLECWQKDPTRRPNFIELREKLDNFFTD